jgi:predicted transposase/invertase (TIGR01784 family)
MLNRNAGNGHFAIFLFPTNFSKNSCKDKTSFPNRRIKIILFLEKKATFLKIGCFEVFTQLKATMANESESKPKKATLSAEEINLHQIDDKIFRATMQNKDALLCFLSEFVPQAVNQHIDFDSLELDNTEYVTGQLKKLQSDVVWKGKFKGKEMRIILLLEHKKDFDRELFVQILLYLCCIWMLDVQNGQPFSCVLPIVVHQGAGGKVWETRDFHHFFAHLPLEFLKHIPNFQFLLTNVQLEPNLKILGLPEENLLRALFLMFQCQEKDEKLKQFFGEIFKFYKNQPHLQAVLHVYLVYIMASFNLTFEQIAQLMDSISPKSKEDIMTAYEVLVSKGKVLGREEGERIHLLKTIWNAHARQLSVSNISSVLNIAPSMVHKWLQRFAWMQEHEIAGLTPLDITLKVNELAGEPAVTELEVTTLLAFFKEQPAPKKKSRRVKKD